MRLDERVLQMERGLLVRSVLRRDAGLYQCHAMEHGFTQTLLGITLEVVPSSAPSLSADPPSHLDPRSGAPGPPSSPRLWYRDFMQLVDHPNLSTVDQVCEQVWLRKNRQPGKAPPAAPAPRTGLPAGSARGAPNKWKHLQEIRKGRNRRTHEAKTLRAPRSAGEW